MGVVSICIYVASSLKECRRTLKILSCPRSREFSVKGCVIFADLSPTTLNVMKEMQPGNSDPQDLHGKGNLEKMENGLSH